MNQPWKIILTAGQFAWCPALNETVDSGNFKPPNNVRKTLKIVANLQQSLDEFRILLKIFGSG